MAGRELHEPEPSQQLWGSLKEDLMSWLSLKALLGDEYMLLTQTSELGEALLGSGLSFLLDNCPVTAEISTVG